MAKVSFDTAGKPTWCPSCGNFGILNSLKNALIKLKLKPENILIVAGIGCSGHLPNWINTYSFVSLHGRTLPVASGAKLANHKLTVLAIAGDGDTYGIGANHLIHTIRRNHDITLIVHNNQLYGLTTGQFSPTTEKGVKTRSSPFGVIEIPLNPLALSISCGGTFVARGYAGDIDHLTNLIVEAVKHKGFSLVDILQPCVTFNKINTFEFFNKRVYKLEETNHDLTNRTQAFIKSQEWGDKIPIGIFYKEERKTFEDELPQIAKQPLVKQDIENVNIENVIQSFV